MRLCELMGCGFDPLHSFVIDAMHNIFLGIAKTLTRLWFSKKFRGKPFSIRKYLKQVDKILHYIAHQVPHEFSRAPRGFEKNYAHYKGTLLIVLFVAVVVSHCSRLSLNYCYCCCLCCCCCC